MIKEINIPITEGDLEKLKSVVYGHLSFSWRFETEDGETIQVNFMSEDELEQREK